MVRTVSTGSLTGRALLTSLQEDLGDIPLHLPLDGITPAAVRLSHPPTTKVHTVVVVVVAAQLVDPVTASGRMANIFQAQPTSVLSVSCSVYQMIPPRPTQVSTSQTMMIFQSKPLGMTCLTLYCNLQILLWMTISFRISS